MAVYLDYNATTPEDPCVREAVGRCARQCFGNASSRDHRWGWDAAEQVERARVELAAVAGTEAPRVVFTSGATEAVASVLRGYVGYANWSAKKIITTATEHEAVLAPARWLGERTGVAVDVLPVDHAGRVSLTALEESVRGAPGSLVALMYANNEVGTVHPIAEIAAIVHAHHGRLLCDTTQAFGKCPVDLWTDGIDYATLSAHKLYGPKGVGALVLGGRVGLHDVEPLMVGGQERSRRGGTLNVPGIAGFGEACRLIGERLEDDALRMARLRQRLEQGVSDQIANSWINGDGNARLCNTANIGFKGVDARRLIREMHDIAVSTRSACSTGKAGPSHVLKAIGLSDEDAYSCIRFSLGRFTTDDEIDYAIEKVVTSVHKLRRLKSLPR